MSDQKFQLLVQRGPEPGKIYLLSSVSITIGRDPMADITIVDPEVSRQHVRLSSTLTGYAIEDLGSTNGTYIDGERLTGEAVDLTVGQIITMGAGVALRFQIDVGGQVDMPTMLDGALIASDFIVEDQEDDLGSPDLVEADYDLPYEEPELAVEDAQDLGIVADELPMAEDERPYMQEVSALPNDLPADQESDSQFIIESENEPLSRKDDVPVVIPHQGEPDEIEPYGEENNWRTPVIIVSLLMLIVCCCCSFFLFLYYYGGDWLLRQMGLLT